MDLTIGCIRCGEEGSGIGREETVILISTAVHTGLVCV